MTFEVWMLILAFFGLLLLPFLPGLLELKFPKDARPVRIDMEYIREARYFGLQFREQVHQKLARETEERGPLAQTGLQPIVTIGPERTAGGLLMALDHIELGRGAQINEAYSYGEVNVEDDAVVESLASDGPMRLGNNVTVKRWVDAEGDLIVGNGCDLGVSASSNRTLVVGDRTEFRRLWGMPVRTSEEIISRYVPVLPTEREEIIGKDTGIEIEDVARWSSGDLTIPAETVVGRDVVAYGDIRIGANSVILGSVKARGSITLDEGVTIEGNVIGQRGVNCIGNATVFGHVFSERDVELGPGSIVGRPEAFKTVFCQTRVLLARGVEVYGWVVADDGGTVG